MSETEVDLTNKLLTLSKEKLFNMVYRDKNKFHVCYKNIAVSRVDELEAEKAELISDFNTLYNGCQNLAIRQYCLAVLQKYEVKECGTK